MDGILKSKLPDVVIPEVPVHEHIFKNISRWHDKVAVVTHTDGSVPTKVTFSGGF